MPYQLALPQEKRKMRARVTWEAGEGLMLEVGIYHILQPRKLAI